MTIKVLSNLDSFAFVDVVRLLKKNPSSFTAEFVLGSEANDSIYYFSRLRKEFKTRSIMISLADVFLKEFKEGIVRDYVFEKIIDFQLFRIDDKVFTIDESIRTVKDFLESIKDQIPRIAKIQFVDQPLKEDVDFLILQGTGNPEDIINLAKFR